MWVVAGERLQIGPMQTDAVHTAFSANIQHRLGDVGTRTHTQHKHLQLLENPVRIHTEKVPGPEETETHYRATLWVGQ